MSKSKKKRDILSLNHLLSRNLTSTKGRETAATIQSLQVAIKQDILSLFLILMYFVVEKLWIQITYSMWQDYFVYYSFKALVFHFAKNLGVTVSGESHNPYQIFFGTRTVMDGEWVDTLIWHKPPQLMEMKRLCWWQTPTCWMIMSKI